MKKNCSKCGQLKPLDQFHKQATGKNGYTANCKSCASNRRKLYYGKNKEHEIARNTAYLKIFKGHEGYRKYLRKYRKENPLKYKAQTLFYEAYTVGEIRKQPCTYPTCHSEYVEAHHWDYLKPYDVVWFCPKHHALADKARRLIDRTSNISEIHEPTRELALAL